MDEQKRTRTARVKTSLTNGKRTYNLLPIQDMEEIMLRLLQMKEDEINELIEHERLPMFVHICASKLLSGGFGEYINALSRIQDMRLKKGA